MSTAALLLLLLFSSMCAACAALLLIVANKQPPGPKPPKPPGPKPPGPKPPGPKPPKPPTTGTVIGPGTGGGGNGSHLKNSDDLWKQVQKNVAELQSHLKKKYPSHPNTVTLFRNFRSLGKTTQSGLGWAGVTSGSRVVINIGGDYYRRLSDVNNTITHEMGHTIGRDSHGPQWRAAFLWLANIAAKDLGWQILMGTMECDSYRICNQPQCPSCQWRGNGRGRNEAPATAQEDALALHPDPLPPGAPVAD